MTIRSSSSCQRWKRSSTTGTASPTTPATTSGILTISSRTRGDADEQEQDDVLELDQTELEELGLTLDDPHQPEPEADGV